MSALRPEWRAERHQCAYRDSEGRIWAYSGKRARVLDMLVVIPQGVTQHDCYPWHTRLSDTIHVMRLDGLAITTEREGPYRHARYRLATRLVPVRHSVNIHRGNTDKAA